MIFKQLFIYVFFCGFAGFLLLHGLSLLVESCCYFLVVVHRLLIVMTSLVAEDRL